MSANLRIIIFLAPLIVLYPVINASVSSGTSPSIVSPKDSNLEPISVTQNIREDLSKEISNRPNTPDTKEINIQVHSCPKSVFSLDSI